MSQEVLDAQKWLNETYGDKPNYISVDETGYPGTATSYALVSALQIELNLPTVTGVFGDATFAACNNSPLTIGSTGNRVKILQHGLYCKGYNAKATDGTFSENTAAALKNIQSDAGLTDSQITETGNGLTMKAVLGVDEYKKVSRGDNKIREMQQELNRNYLSYTGLRPCDGIYSRGTNTALIYAIQAAEGLPVSVANGNFGATTKRCCPDIPYSGVQKNYNGNTYTDDQIKQFTKLAQFILYCIGHDEYSALPFDGSKYNPGSFNGEFNDNTKSALHSFQNDVALAERDIIGIDEWMSLLLSTGNPDRAGTAFDCATRLTADTAKELYNRGYRYVGRYLTGDIVVNNTRVAKNLLRPEMTEIFKAGLRLFVIFQDARQYYTENPEEDDIFNYFNEARGYADAEKAFSVAKSLGVPRGEIIYFTVDYDFMAAQVTSRIIPYFKGINDYAEEAGNIFQIGIYGSRNTCTLVKNAGYSVSSFVADLSTGFSGNMGYPLPEDWAFDQIKEYGAGAAASISIDKNIASGRYEGFNGFEQEHDNEWDNIYDNGYALVLMTDGGNTYPIGRGEIPVYWAKVETEDGKFEAKYPMYDSIKVGAFYSVRTSNVGSNIQYVYFRDVGGKMNAGYIDREATKEFERHYYGEVIIWINRSADSILDKISMYYSPAPDYRVDKIHQILTKPVKAYTSGGTLYDVLPAGTKVELPCDSVTGRSYPYMIRCTAIMRPKSEEWEYLIPGASYGFLDLDFEHGVMPDDRNMIMGYDG